MTATTKEPNLIILTVSFAAAAISMYVLVKQIWSDAETLNIAMAAGGAAIFSVLFAAVLWQMWKG